MTTYGLDGKQIVRANPKPLAAAQEKARKAAMAKKPKAEIVRRFASLQSERKI